MRKIIFKRKWLFLLVCLVGVVFSVSLSISAIFDQRFFDTLGVGSWNAVVRAAAAMLLINGLMASFFLLNEVLNNRFVNGVANDIRGAALTAISKQEYRSHVDKGDSDYISLLTNNIERLKNSYLSLILFFSAQVITLVASVVIMLFYNISIALICVVGGVFSAFLPMITSKMLEKKNEECAQKLAGYTKVTEELLHGFEVLFSFGMAEYRKKMDKKVAELRKAENSEGDCEALVGTLSQIIGVLFTLGITFFCGYMIFLGRMTFGEWIALSALRKNFSGSLSLSLQIFPAIKAAKPFYKDIDELLSAEEDNSIIEAKDRFGDNLKSIDVCNISFGYDDEKKIIDDFSMNITKGDHIALVGENGSGKSTIAHLLSGYYKCDEGEIKVNGKQVDETSLNSIVSYVPQNVYIFSGSIKENVSMDEEFSEEEINNVYDLFELSDLVQQKEAAGAEGIGEEGSNLSGGERQRIALARAYLRKRPVIILDEGTSAIDAETAKSIEENLFKDENLTLIVITHDVSAEHLGRFDKVIKLETDLSKAV
jgi:ABC-type multidrug transport system fused ATPase/permease subunit